MVTASDWELATGRPGFNPQSTGKVFER